MSGIDPRPDTPPSPPQGRTLKNSALISSLSGIEPRPDTPPSPPQGRTSASGVDPRPDTPPSPPQGRTLLSGIDPRPDTPPSPPQGRTLLSGIEPRPDTPPSPPQGRTRKVTVPNWGMVDTDAYPSPPPSLPHRQRVGLDIIKFPGEPCAPPPKQDPDRPAGGRGERKPVVLSLYSDPKINILLKGPDGDFTKNDPKPPGETGGGRNIQGLGIGRLAVIHEDVESLPMFMDKENGQKDTMMLVHGMLHDLKDSSILSIDGGLKAPRPDHPKAPPPRRAHLEITSLGGGLGVPEPDRPKTPPAKHQQYAVLSY